MGTSFANREEELEAMSPLNEVLVRLQDETEDLEQELHRLYNKLSPLIPDQKVPSDPERDEPRPLRGSSLLVTQLHTLLYRLEGIKDKARQAQERLEL